MKLQIKIDDDGNIVVDLDLQLHDVAAGRGADEARADARVVLVHGPDVEGLLEVVDDLLVVGPRRPAGPGPPGGDRGDAAQGQHGATRRAGAREASGRGRGEDLGEELGQRAPARRGLEELLLLLDANTGSLTYPPARYPARPGAGRARARRRGAASSR